MSETLVRLANAAILPRSTAGWFNGEAVRPPPIASLAGPSVAVLIPCFNEEAAIAGVVADFRAVLPWAAIYVYDNNSTDGTMQAASAAGAIVREERLQGKGHVVRRMFADIDADIYVLTDGDGTYDAAAAAEMVRLLRDNRLDMVSAARASAGTGAYRPGHRFGNRVLTGMVRLVFGDGVTDMLSGYRVFSRRFVKSFPALAERFETETEFTIHALTLNMPIREVRTMYRERAAGSRSKLSTIPDGLRILRTIVMLIQQERPLPFFSLTALGLLGLGCSLGAPVVVEYLHSGLVPRLPTAVLATGTILLAFLALGCGLILDAVSRGRKEMKRLAYLSVPDLGGAR